MAVFVSRNESSDRLLGRSSQLLPDRLLHRQHHNKFRTPAQSALCSDAPPVPLRDLAAYGETDAGTAVPAPAVEALKDREYSVQVFVVEADAIVLHGDTAYITGVGPFDYIMPIAVEDLPLIFTTGVTLSR